MSKKFVRERGTISIKTYLESFGEMKLIIGTQLSNMLRFLWRVKMRVRETKKRKEEKKKKKMAD